MQARRLVLAAAVSLFLCAPRWIAAQTTVNGFATVSPGILNIGSYSYNCLQVTASGQAVNHCAFASQKHFAVDLGTGADISFPGGAGIELELDAIHATQPVTLSVASASFRYSFAARAGLHPFLQAGYGRGFASGPSQGLLVLGVGADRWFAPKFGWRVGLRSFLQRRSQQGFGLGGTIPVPSRRYYLFTLALLFR